MAKYKGRKMHSNFSYKNFHPHHSYDQGHYHIYNSSSTTGRGFETAVDLLAGTSHKPSLIHGDLTLLGKDSSVIKQLNRFKSGSADKSSQPAVGYLPPSTQHQPLQSHPSDQQPKQLTIAVVGDKLSSASYCCFLLTIASSILLLLPLLCMLTTWWKRIVSPLYEVKTEFYQSLALFLSRHPYCKKMTLTVVDNGFGVEKSEMLLSALQKSKIQSFTFLNRALPCHLNEDEGENFRDNVAKIKKLARVDSRLVWGDVEA